MFIENGILFLYQFIPADFISSILSFIKCTFSYTKKLITCHQLNLMQHIVPQHL